jgi:precorrin-6B methylase 2
MAALLTARLVSVSAADAPAVQTTTKKTAPTKATTKPAAKAAKPAPKRPRYEFRRNHDPNGIGKFYMGREIAHVMGAAAIPWLERPEREKEEELTTLVEALDLQPGQIVADIGAGSGVITLMMAEKVGESGKVVAVDVQQEMLDAIAFKLKERRLDNVELILSTNKDPRLNPALLDLAIMVDVYHEFEFPYEMMLKISAAMKPGGRVVFVEFRMEDPAVPIKLVHKMTQAQVKKEVAHPEFRLKWKETIDVLPWQHIIIFERLADDAPAAEPGDESAQDQSASDSAGKSSSDDASNQNESPPKE